MRAWGWVPRTGEGQSSAQRQDQATPWGAALLGRHWGVMGGAVGYGYHPVPVQRTGGWGEAEVSAKMPQQVWFIP